jgi:hypothetical protein
MSRANRILTIALAVIVVLAVVAALVSRTRSAPELEPGSPEATVQAYVDAALAGKSDEAARLLEPGGECSADDLARTTGMGAPSVRVVLVHSSVEGSTATVEVKLVYATGDPFTASEYTEPHIYRLKRSGNAWVLTGVPWPLVECWKE